MQLQSGGQAAAGCQQVAVSVGWIQRFVGAVLSRVNGLCAQLYRVASLRQAGVRQAAMVPLWTTRTTKTHNKNKPTTQQERTNTNPSVEYLTNVDRQGTQRKGQVGKAAANPNSEHGHCSPDVCLCSLSAQTDTLGAPEVSRVAMQAPSSLRGSLARQQTSGVQVARQARQVCRLRSVHQQQQQ